MCLFNVETLEALSVLSFPMSPVLQCTKLESPVGSWKGIPLRSLRAAWLKAYGFIDKTKKTVCYAFKRNFDLSVLQLSPLCSSSCSPLVLYRVNVFLWIQVSEIQVLSSVWEGVSLLCVARKMSVHSMVLCGNSVDVHVEESVLLLAAMFLFLWSRLCAHCTFISIWWPSTTI